MLQVAPSTYYAAKSRPASARAVRDAVMIPILVALWVANYRVYGAHKLWKAARRAGHDIGRDQVARLMRQAGIEGVRRRRAVAHDHGPIRPRRGRRISSNVTSPRAHRTQLWVTDLTYVATWSGVAYVCFIVDAFSRMIVGWRVAAHMRTDMVLDALEMARWSRGTRLEGLVAHSDAGSQFTSIRYGERLAELGARPVDRLASVTATTTRSPRPSTGSTRPSSSAGPAKDHGRPSRKSSSRRSAGCTGTTPNASTATSATCPRPSSKPLTTLRSTTTSEAA